jgi:hypothetical protein
MDSKPFQVEQNQQSQDQDQDHELKDRPRAVEASPQPENTDVEDSPKELERWNSTRINSYRYYATNLSFLIMGMNDASLGVSCALHMPKAS